MDLDSFVFFKFLKWMKSVLLIRLTVVVVVFFSQTSFALPNGYFAEEQLAQQVIDSGCSPDEVRTRDEFLKSPAGQQPDRLLFCESSCGNSGCTYFVFLRNQEAFDLYRFAGNFSGQFEILRSLHEGYFDIQVKQHLGLNKNVRLNFG